MSEDSKNVLPLSGFRDFGPEEQSQRIWLINKALDVYRRFGYFPIETPALEREEILRGQYGEEGDTLRYKFEDNGKRLVGLRYDLTVPFSRFVARFLPTGDIKLPFRRSQVAPVWRAESPQAGRFREFYQCDFDIAGSDSPVADAEVFLIAATLLKEIGFDYVLCVNNRVLIDSILKGLGVPEDKTNGVLIALDKLEKIGIDSVIALLIDEQIGLDKKTAKKLTDVVVGNKLDVIKDLIDDPGLQAMENLTSSITMAQKALGDATRIRLDLSIVRGLAYYTGVVLETKVKGAESMGSVLSGGRFDNTIGTFLGKRIPAVGASLGIDRCVEVLRTLEMLPKNEGKVDLVVLPMGDCRDFAFELAGRLRGRISVVVFTEDAKPREMFGYASGMARFAMVVGSNEVESHTYKLKNLGTTEQIDAKEDQIVDSILST